MFKPTFFMVLLTLSVLTFAVFQVEHRVQSLRSKNELLNKQISEEKDNIHILKAEWTYLTQPKRLQEMADRYTDLRPTKPEQIKPITNIPFSTSKSASLLTYASLSN